MRRWTVTRNPRGPGYILVDEDGVPMTGSDGAPRVYDSSRAAQDDADRDHAWQDSGGTAEGGDSEAAAEGLGGTIDANAERRRSAADPGEQQARYDAGQARDPYADAYADDAQVSQTDRDLAGIPFSPTAGRVAQAEADANRSIWEDLGLNRPTPNDLAVQYEQDQGVGLRDEDPAMIEAQQRALSGFEDIYESGGLTAADRGRLQQGEREMGRAMRGQRDADMAALQARGMGGSGASMASMFSAQQGGANMLADREADIQSRAEQRAMEAMGAAGSMAGQMRGQTQDYNRWNTDYERDRSRWNTEQRNRSAESMSDARQQDFQNRTTVAAGSTDQYSGDASRQDARTQRDREDVKDGVASLAELFDF